MNTRHALITIAALAIVACNDQATTPRAVGQLESERIELTAVAADILTARPITEGSRIAAGDVIFELDTGLVQTRVDEAQALVAELKSALEELLAGTRVEVLQAARAQVAGARDEKAFRASEVKRMTGLVERGLISDEQLDQAQIAVDTATATLDAASARMNELTQGPRQQTIEQAAARLQRAQAAVRAQQILLDRYQARAPAGGILDRYLFEIGERPNAGQAIAILLSGDQPHARVYVPADLRSRVHAGDTVAVYIDGFAQSLEGTVRWVASEAAFTPYFALTQHDRNRLSYLAKIDLPDTDRRLPDGVPLEVEFTVGRE